MPDKYKELRKEIESLKRQSEDDIDGEKSENIEQRQRNLRQELRREFTKPVEYNEQELRKNLKSQIDDVQNNYSPQNSQDIYRKIIEIRFYRNKLEKNSNLNTKNQLVQNCIKIEEQLWNTYYQETKNSPY